MQTAHAVGGSALFYIMGQLFAMAAADNLGARNWLRAVAALLLCFLCFAITGAYILKAIES